MVIVKETWELLLPIIATINKTFKGKTVVENSPGDYTITACSTLWLTIGYNLTIGANIYKIVDLMPNQWIRLKGDIIPSVLEFDIYTPFNFHGTIIAQSEELNEIANSWDKLPMIYLHEITREKFHESDLDTIDRDSDCDFYFMVDCNIQDWKTSDHYKYAVRPMRNLLFAFVKALKESGKIGLFNTYDVFDHAKWGVYISDKGHTKQIFKDHLSGTQLRITIPFLKEFSCGDCSM